MKTPSLKLFIKELKTAAYQKYQQENGRKQTAPGKITDELNDFLSRKYNLTSNSVSIKMQTMHKRFITHKLDVNFNKINSANTTLLVLCAFLCDRTEISEFYGRNLYVELLKELKHKSYAAINNTTISELMNELSVPEDRFPLRYIFNFSTGDKDPEIAVLAFSSDGLQSRLKFHQADDKSEYVGKVSKAKNNKTVFANLEEKSTGYVAFLSMVIRDDLPTRPQRIDGYYCSALRNEDGDPVAGKFIAIRDDQGMAESLSEEGKVDAQLSSILFNQRFSFKSAGINLKDIQFFRGIYEGYWCKITHGIKTIVKVAFSIEGNGKVIIRGEEAIDTFGYVHYLNNDVLKSSKAP